MATCRDGILAVSPDNLGVLTEKKSPFRKNLAIFFVYIRKK